MSVPLPPDAPGLPAPQRARDQAHQAEQQGQAAARNMLGDKEPYAAAPFFWSAHYDVAINYVGAAQDWDEVKIVGSIPDRDCLVAYRKNGKTLAVASVNRDAESLRIQVAMDRGDVGAVEAVLQGR